MATPFRQHIDLGGNELRNARIQNLSTAPSAPGYGQVYYSTGTNVLYAWNGTSWRPLDAAALTDGSVPIAALAVNPLARANHTGTQTSSTISDLATTVKSYTLDAFASPVAQVSFNNQQLVNLPTATQASSPPRYDQVQSMIAAAIAGQTAIKNPVRLAATSNITLSGTQTIDGVAANVGDRVAVIAQTTGSQNNIYVVASGAWSIATDCNSNSSWIEGTEFLVAEGTQYGGSIFRQTTTGAITIGTTTLNFVQTAKINTYTADETTVHQTGNQFSAKRGAGITVDANGLAIDTSVVVRKYSATITGDGSTTTFTVVHNLASSDVMVMLKDSTGLIDFADINTANVNQVTVSFAQAPPNGTTYRVNVQG